MKSDAVFSPDRVHRYALYRTWGSGPTVLFIMLNPSTADETLNDPTVRRCIVYARRWGFGGLRVANIFAFRATKPADMKSAVDPIGPDNDQWICRLHQESEITIAAWGKDGAFLNREEQVKVLLPNLYCLKLTNQGRPCHPLYLRGDLLPIPFGGEKVASRPPLSFTPEQQELFR